jgi:nanoRNase/pAp phosphatase (c-di-AMP/oligoRNAs hydrolase)
VLSEPILFSIGAFEVPLFNITNHQSACGNILSTKLDASVGMYTVHGNEVRLSFRSLPHHVPSALTLAETLGGGGHHNASGARMSLSVFVNHIVH